MEDSEWERASEYFDNALDINPKYAQAYIGLLCVDLKIINEMKLKSQKNPLTDNPFYKKALRFANKDYRVSLEKYNQIIYERIEKQQSPILKRLT